MPGPRKAGLGTIFFIVFLDLLGFGIVIPQLGIYGYTFGASPLTVGLLMSAYSFMQLLFAPILGRLSDRFGRRPVLILSLAGSAVGYLMFAFAGSLPMLFASRIIDGISGGNIATAQAYIADVTDESNRAKGMGLIGAAFGLGFILGPAAGGLLGAWGGGRAIGLAAASMTLLALLGTVFFLPEPERHRAGHQGRLFSSLLTTSRTPVVGLIIFISFFFTTAFAQMEATLSLLVIERFLLESPIATSGSFLFTLADVDPAVSHQASRLVGFLFLLVGIIASVVQGGLIGRLKKRFGESKLVLVGAGLLVLGLAALPFAPGYALMFIPMGVVALGSSLVSPSLAALASVHTPKDKQGETLGSFQSAGSMGRIVGPAIGGMLFTALGRSAPYLTASVMMFCCALLVVVLRRRIARAAAPSPGAPGER